MLSDFSPVPNNRGMGLNKKGGPTDNPDINKQGTGEYCNNCNVSVGEVRQLVPHLGNKNKYFLHHRNLQLYLQLEMKFVGI